MPIATEVIDLLHRTRFRYSDEDELQEGIAQALRERGYPVRREVIVAPGCRIDALVGDVGIEVKVAGKTLEVLAQLRRYAESPLIGALVLVTNRPRHDMPATLVGKPVDVVCIAGAGL